MPADMPTLMLAAHVTAYGGPEVIDLRRIPRPIPRAGEVLLRILASPVTSGDMRLRSRKVPRGMGLPVRLAVGWSGPRNPIPGWGFVAEVVSGDGPPAGTRVAGLAGFRGGAHAEYICMAANGPLLPVPPSLDTTQTAALLFGGLTAAHFLIDRARLTPSDRLWINGATGAVGCAALRLARHIGAQVTATASAPRENLARSLGANAFQPYENGPPQGPFDVVMDVIGTAPYARARTLLAPGGRHLAVTATLAETLSALLRPRSGGHYRIAGTNSDDRPALQRVLSLMESGALAPIPAQTFAFPEIRAAHAVAETLHKPGALVLLMDR